MSSVVEDHATDDRVPPADGVDEQASHLVAHLLDRLADAGEVRPDRRGDGGVVEPGDRHVFGHPPAGGGEGRQRAGRHQIGGGEHRVDVRPGLEQALHRARAALLGEVADGLEGRIGITVGTREGVPVPAEAIDSCGHVLRARDRGDGPPAAADEVLDRRSSPAPVVDIDIGRGGALRGASDGRPSAPRPTSGGRAGDRRRGG